MIATGDALLFSAFLWPIAVMLVLLLLSILARRSLGGPV